MSRRVQVIRVPQTVQVPPGNITGAEWAPVASAAAQVPIIKNRVLDLADYVDITGTTDSTSGFQQAINASVASGAPTVLFLRSGATVRISGSLSWPDSARQHVHLIGDGPIGARIIATTADPVIIMDPSATPTTSTRRNYWWMQNLRISGPGKGVAGSTALLLNNANLGHLSNVVISDFHIGIDVDAHNLDNGAASYYNNFYNVRVFGANYGMIFRSAANSNKVFGGAIKQCSEAAVWIQGQAYPTNDVGFFGTDIEGNTGESAVVVDGTGNQFFGCRFENSGTTYDIHFRNNWGSGSRNAVIGNYHSSLSTALRIKDDSEFGNTIMRDGLVDVGTLRTVQDGEMFRGRRITVTNDRPAVDIVDTQQSSGYNTGYRYRSNYPAVPFIAERSRDGGGTFHTMFKMEHLESSIGPYGSPSFRVGNSVTPTNQNRISWGAGDPNGAVIGRIGDIWMRTNGGAGTTMYVKESGNGTNTGWVGK